MRILNNYYIQITFWVIITFTKLSFPQVVYTPSNHYVYEFLERLSLKRVIEFHNEVLPETRKTIAEYLLEASGKTDLLNEIEKKELDWYSEEYAYEMKLDETKQRWYLYSYSDSLLSFKVSPKLGYGVKSFGPNKSHIRWPGIYTYFTYSDWFGGSFEYVDYGEFGDNVDRKKVFTPLTGHFFKSVPNGIEFSDVKGSINLNWNWGTISLIKDYTTWGHGKFGQLILSNKAASFPQIRLLLKPVKWLCFYYMHGWLNSQVYDSSYFQYNHIESSKPFLMKKYIDKYVALNMLTISPFDWMDLSAGNSFVYSGDLRPEVFIPFMYYKVLDHNTGREGLNDGNGMIFFDIAFKYPKEFLFYTTLLIDVLEIREILDGNWKTSWFGYTVGGKKIDIILENLDLTIEYTRTDPWLYENDDETTTYKHLNYPLGHWLGQNADQLRMQLNYQFIRGLKVTVFGEYIRKGGLKDIAAAYSPDRGDNFLYSPVRKDIKLGFEASYEIIHDFFAKAFYSYSDITDENLTRTPSFLLGKKHSFGFTVHYGM